MHERSAKLSAALERLAQAQRVLLWETAGSEGLSPIQLQLLLELNRTPSRLSDLARRFDLSKATLSETIATLKRKKLLIRTPDPTDARAALLSLSEEGRALAERLESWDAPLRHAVERLDPDTQTALLEALLHLIADLQATGVISVARMCLTCRFFRPGQGTPHYCELLAQPLTVADLRLECPEHQAA